MNLTAYEGKEPYVFVSYAHKDSKLVLPIIEKLQSEGFRVWFDQGIEAGTEWPEYVEDRLCDCKSTLVFMSNNAVESVNCRNEINLALSLKKDVLIVYLEETTLRHGMRLQLSSVQSMFAYRNADFNVFLSELCKAKLIAECMGNVSAPKYSEGLNYELSEDGTFYSVTGMGTCTDTELKIPPSFNGKPVRCIGKNAFNPNMDGNGLADDLISVLIPESVTIIEDYAFFNDGGELKSVNIPNNITKIGKQAFNFCNINNIFIPNSVMSIGEYAFNCCEYLQNITVGINNQNYKSIDGNLYTKDGATLIQYACGKDDTSFNIPSCVKTVGDGAFEQCHALKSVNIPNGVTKIGDTAFCYCTELTDITIPNSVKSIGESAFTHSSLTSITIPDGVQNIGDDAFSCTDIASISLPSSVRIGVDVLDGCEKLTCITVDKNNANYKSIDGNLYTKDGAILLKYAVAKSDTYFIIPDGVTIIWESAFASCKALQAVYIPNSVKRIDRDAFYYCESLYYIYYNGTCDMWRNVQFTGSWNLCTHITQINCTDGVVTL